MQGELTKAKLIRPGMADGQSVTVGSSVLARSLASGQVETFIFLGPWDAEPDKRVYSYRAPLGLAFMGKKTGDVVVLRTDAEERKWKILEIRAGI